jgi:phosphoenolpyruvate synthase/pyruvate phosphate dikinase
MLAALTATQEFVLTDDEAKRLASAAANVQRHYPIPAISPGKMALGVFFWTCGAIYMPKFKRIAARKQGIAPDTQQPAPQAPSLNADNVTELRPSAWDFGLGR